MLDFNGLRRREVSYGAITTIAGSLPRAWLCATAVAVSLALPAALLSVEPAQAQTEARYSKRWQKEFVSGRAPEAVELSGLVASAVYPHWYWAHSEVWKPTDRFARCHGLHAGKLRRCQQDERARLWAIKLDPVTHHLLRVRSFRLRVPGWALDRDNAQPNDWEDLAIGPVRHHRDGNVSSTLVIAATGNARANPVRGDSGQDVTCRTRRLIELREPDLRNPLARTWDPWRVYDLANWVGLGHQTTCNVESLMVARPPGDNRPRAYLLTRDGGGLFSRSLHFATSRAPTAPRQRAGSRSRSAPAIHYVGRVATGAGARFTAADVNGRDVALLSPGTAGRPCQVFVWPRAAHTLATSITSRRPRKDTVSCNGTEGLAYTRNPRTMQRTSDLVAIADTALTLRYWFLRDR